MTQNDAVETILRGGIVPIVRLPDLSKAAPLAQALLAGGVTAVELTMTSPGAIQALAHLRASLSVFDDGQAVLGMGSVQNAEMAQAAIDAGAQFVVSPMLDLPMIERCVALGVPVMPGALTPSELQAAWVAGAPVVKLFPATAFGPGYLKDVLAPLPHLRLMATGGVDLENAAAFLRHGAVALGVGSSLVSGPLVASADWASLTARAAAFVRIVREARG